MRVRALKVGDSVVYHDTVGHPHNALVTAGWGDGAYNPCINILYVSDDANKTDNYGRQIERESSVSHVSQQRGAFGRYWRWSDETPIDVTPATIK